MAGRELGHSDGRARGPLAPRIVAQVHELHDAVVQLSSEVGGFASRQARRELKVARQSESDLLRVLGFDNYDEFVRTLSDVGVASVDGTDELVILEETASGPERRANGADTDEALEVERVLRGLRDMTNGGRSLESHGPRPARLDPLDSFRDRVGAFEEELAEVRFELTRMHEEMRAMRERLALAETSEAVVVSEDTAAERLATRLEATFCDLAQSLATTAAELTNIFGQLQRERAELTTIAQEAREEAGRILGVAREEALRARDDANIEAGKIVTEAQAQASAVIRDAMVTLEGLRHLHDADAGDAPV